MINGLLGVSIGTYNSQGLADFYKNILGVEPGLSRDNLVIFRMGANNFELEHPDEVRQGAPDPAPFAVNFAVSDIEKLCADLKAKGVKFTREPGPLPGPAGIWIAAFQDPEGNYVQLVQRP